MILIYSCQTTSRSKYTFNLLFRDLLHLSHQITHDLDTFLNYKGPKINYSKQKVGDACWIYDKGLLFEKGIKLQDLKPFNWKHIKALYPAPKVADFPFDVFSATFYLVSRYEEYLPHFKDKHGRFVAEQSVAYQECFLDKPAVDYYAIALHDTLKEKFPELPAYKRKYKFQPTIDIDNAYAIRNKGFERIIAGVFKEIIGANFAEAKARISVALHFKPDPYDTYDYQLELIKKHKLDVIYFILLGDYAQFDKNVSAQNKNMQALIKFLADYGKVGIHPSYASHRSIQKLQKEINRLSGILHEEIKMSRQHFLKFTLPETFQRLLEAGITDEYSMGYPSQVGFRASTCSAHFFYDLDLETETSLKIHPFAVMDGTLKDYLNLPKDKIFKTVKVLIDEVKNVQGTFITLWHNETMAETKKWNGWRLVYEKIIKEATKSDEDSVFTK